MRHPATPPGSPAPAPLASPKSGAIKRQRKAAAPLSDVTNRLLPETPTPIKPRRTGLRPLPTPSDASSTCSSTASVTPAPQPSSAAVIEEERSAVKSPISTVYARRGTTETRRRRRRTNPTTTTPPRARNPLLLLERRVALLLEKPQGRTAGEIALACLIPLQFHLCLVCPDSATLGAPASPCCN
ncbi:hypothetical protein GQ55_8G008300 [Panicum hallii var. hallii]|uniref:Uncharacterized protein n=1 Tax=Panicum hallii var. hallii TaxID=1504633 RepID=A0A2T7CJB7_9POAL|nr:hypothetical protein GQ55_8G008300 [Panicum hallii var. hallii]